ncbi:hypothetical protein VTK73DRAFT_4102 [Phialemonium thermophilum]|uniref:Uncharacterized protein n=1 Tax=Phialemonium thermophilum TaxID=223376 RepID=A0ABR3WV70_9PEZI
MVADQWHGPSRILAIVWIPLLIDDISRFSRWKHIDIRPDATDDFMLVFAYSLNEPLLLPMSLPALGVSTTKCWWNGPDCRSGHLCDITSLLYRHAGRELRAGSWHSLHRHVVLVDAIIHAAGTRAGIPNDVAFQDQSRRSTPPFPADVLYKQLFPTIGVPATTLSDCPSNDHVFDWSESPHLEHLRRGRH